MSRSDKSLTLMLIPFDDRGIKKRNLSHRFLKGLALALVVHFLALAFYGIHYAVQRHHIRQTGALQAHNAHLKAQVRRAHDRLVLRRNQISSFTDVDRLMRAWIDVPEPGPEIRQLGVGGGEDTRIPNDRLSPEMNGLISDVFRELDQITRETGFLEASFDTITSRLRRDENQRQHLPSILPVPEAARYRLASDWGYRTDPFTGRQEFHNGLDISGRRGTDVLATADGIVEKVSRDRRLGYYIALKHGFGIRTLYGHLRSLPGLKPGGRVKRGDVIGSLGNTGRTTAPHIHYAIFKNGRPINPRDFIYNHRPGSLF